MDVEEEPSSDDTWTLAYFFISIYKVTRPLSLKLAKRGRFSGKAIDISGLG